jgi:enterochelin esterase-like enzyme
MRAGEIVEGELTGGEVRTIECAASDLCLFRATLVSFDRPVRIAAFGPDHRPLALTVAGNAFASEISFTPPRRRPYRLELSAPNDGAQRRFALRAHHVAHVRAERDSLPPPHPLIVALEAAWAAGDRGALERFWDTLRDRGTPLIADVNAGDPSVAVTFVRRGGAEVSRVDLWAAGRWQAMTRLAATDVWHASMLVRRGTRFLYDIYVRSADPLSADGNGLDPLNPRAFPARVSSSGAVPRSVLELADAAPMTWSSPPALAGRGRVVVRTFRSTILNNSRAVWTYTPPDYDRQREPCHLLLLFDGQDYIDGIDLPGILDGLHAAGKIPPLVAVLVGNAGPATRWRELRCDAALVEAITTELMLWVRGRWRVRADPDAAIIGGFSRGGLAAAWVAFRAPKTFGHAICQSGAFWWAPDADPLDVEQFDPYHEPNWLSREIARHPYVPVSFHLVTGTYDGLHHTRQLRDVLMAKGNAVTFQEFHGAHDLLGWRASLPIALLNVFNR